MGFRSFMKSLRFATVHPPPPADLPVTISNWLRNIGVAAVCHPIAEGIMMRTGCMYFEKSGDLLPGQGKKLGRLMGEAYGNMARTRGYLFTGSAVPFFLGSKPKGGHFFLHVPKGADPSTPVLLLLHGYGGNLLYFPWAVQKEMPECVLVAPSWQVAWTEGSFKNRRDYVEMALSHASDKIGWRLQKPWLVPLSQGGSMAFELAAKRTAKFTGLLGISTFAENTDSVRSLPSSFPVRLLHGDADDRIPCECVSKTIRAIRGAGGDAKITVIPGADHFLILSHRKQMGKFLRENI